MLRLKNCYLNDLDKVLKNKKVYAYGAGNYLDNFQNRNPEICIENYLYMFVDKKKGTKKIGEKELEILSIEELRKKIIPTDIILITTSHYYVEIIEIMDRYLEFDDITTYVLPFIENNFESNEINWDLYYKCRKKEEIIPKTIHYCWFGGNEIPEYLKKYMESWKVYCPNYEIIRWSEDNYDIKKNEYIYEAYKNKKWAFISDYARIDIVNKYGGIYLDTDVELVRPLDELLHFNGFMGFETKALVNTGLGFGSHKDNVILKKILERYHQRKFLNNFNELDLTPCPVIQTEVLLDFGLKRNNQMQNLENNFMIFPTSFFGGMNFGTRQIKIQENTYSIHHYAGSWVESSKDIFKKREDASGLLLQRMCKE